MSEKEKMLNGEIYDSNDKEIVKERLKAKDLCYEYNQAIPSDLNRKKEIIKELGIQTEEEFYIEPSFYCDYGYNIKLGKRFYSNHNTVILDGGKVTFGDDVFIGPNCGFYTACHPIDVENRNKRLEFTKPITVGNNVWIGGSVTVLPGVTIGDNTVIGAGSVVVKDIPSNVIAVGNPCKVVRGV